MTRRCQLRSDIIRVGSGASADNSLRSAAEALKGTLVSDGKRLEITHFCFAACGSSIRQEVFAGPKSLDAPEPNLTRPWYDFLPHCQLTLRHRFWCDIAPAGYSEADTTIRTTTGPPSSYLDAVSRATTGFTPESTRWELGYTRSAVHSPRSYATRS